MKNNSLYLLLICLLASCTSVAKKLEKKHSRQSDNFFLDVSKKVKFNEKDRIQEIDEKYFSTIRDFLENHEMEVKVLIIAEHEDRLYHGNLQSRINSICDYIAAGNLDIRSKLNPKIALDFNKKYSTKYKAHSILLVLK